MSLDGVVDRSDPDNQPLIRIAPSLWTAIRRATADGYNQAIKFVGKRIPATVQTGAPIAPSVVQIEAEKEDAAIEAAAAISEVAAAITEAPVTASTAIKALAAVPAPVATTEAPATAQAPATAAVEPLATAQATATAAVKIPAHSYYTGTCGCWHSTSAYQSPKASSSGSLQKVCCRGQKAS
ncbi:hypothetical protein SARC_10381 [Sphaeroforma arctica JP610]|uniref:Uncharacterized protein n=1 Tax=Sphaeroforma arctica JP610 TaxID=667725 RepID=A0A0L0FL14_9EUKA|nr:hypothetical protein SARC_10381 [Sphaeroforma arctica JP610]KNC77151.1 hypothetical protein SARC_10381 [Sphaeroforma arctica JP610]|eukprot:XP_014151053.1 hypothetical protein SARC_10381 [Sphaeroforma arctica JP610]